MVKLSVRHIIFFSCMSYDDLRQTWLSSIEKPAYFDALSIEEQFKIDLNITTNIKPTANFILDAFDKRSKILY